MAHIRLVLRQQKIDRYRGGDRGQEEYVLQVPYSHHTLRVSYPAHQINKCPSDRRQHENRLCVLPFLFLPSLSAAPLELDYRRHLGPQQPANCRLVEQNNQDFQRFIDDVEGSQNHRYQVKDRADQVVE